MGVKGLWSLLNPVSRPVQCVLLSSHRSTISLHRPDETDRVQRYIGADIRIESLEGKRLAIDSSIWLYQFQATMRDKDGRVLVNAHVLGFLRRINKLLFHGIKPVFVFDGGAPALKRATIAERKRRKAGAAANHARMAEKLFAAQMRREAVKVAQTQAARSAATATSRYAEEESEQIPEDAVYLEDLEGRPGPSMPRPARPPPSATTEDAAPEEPPDPREERRKRFKKHDPYRLPEASMPTVSTEDKPDARLATEEELKQFIDEMRPSDIDIESAEFRALPTEVQYEIIGDLRIRSRQQSHKRLTEMLRRAPSALDFSQAQIKHLAQRNALTQQLLTVTDMVGSAHLTIPVRIAAERNREYVLVKRGEEAGGGWALGIREGTKANPIVVDQKAPLHSDSDDDSDEDTEGSETDESEIREVSPPGSSRQTQGRSRTNSGVDVEGRDARRKEVLEALTLRYAPSKRSSGSVVALGEEVEVTDNDEALALALQQEELGSEEEEADPGLVRALGRSRREAARSPAMVDADEAEDDGIEFLEERSNGMVEARDKGEESDESLEEVSLVPSERSTPVPFAEGEEDEDEEMEEVPSIAGSLAPPPLSIPQNTPPAPQAPASALAPRNRDATHAAILTVDAPPPVTGTALSLSRPHGDAAPKDEDQPIAPPASRIDSKTRSDLVATTNGHAKQIRDVKAESPMKPAASAEPKQIPRPTPPTSNNIESAPKASPIPHPPTRTPSSNRPAIPSPLSRPPSPPANAFEGRPKSAPPSPSPPPPPLTLVAHEPERMIDPALVSGPSKQAQVLTTSPLPAPDPEDEDWEPEEPRDEDEDDDGYDDGALQWSRSPSLTASASQPRPPLQAEMSTESIGSEPDIEEDEGELAAEDVIAEKDDYARFMAQIKNRDLNEVRTEIDDEIRVLHNQAKVALRDSDEITQAMISQIQTLLRHFGIPYITAPMEAEAQCAKLAQLGLVDGIITDDSDVFLFGGIQCFKNIFNDAKYAECFLLTDIDRELSLSRDRLISLAYLLGSDYTIGLPGVGPVVALELLSNFPGPKGVDKFKDWWLRVQRGQDLPVEADTKWKVAFRYAASIFLTSDWPNPLVREAYRYPTCDESDEPFHWGFPKLSALRAFLHEELSWSISKVADELTPIVQRIARRGKAGALNVQGTLDPFFDTGAGSGNYAPRRRTTANVSKRLLAVIKAYREAEARVAGREEEVEWGTMLQGLDPEDPKGRGTGKRRRTPSTGPEELEKMEVEEGVEEDWERKAAELAAKEESLSQSATPAPAKRKRAAPRPKKSQEGSVAGEDAKEDDGDDEELPKRKKAPAKRKSRTASRGESSKDPGETEGLEAIPPKDMKERRAQQKKWRRTVVAGSLNR